VNNKIKHVLFYKDKIFNIDTSVLLLLITQNDHCKRIDFPADKQYIL